VAERQIAHPPLGLFRTIPCSSIESGAQPLIYADGKKNLSCAVNGEIYNWKELRDGLKDRSVPMVTGSDCEVIMHLVSTAFLLLYLDSI
jgi:asparagine synthetase B (glutamine-hydrolysing)